MSEGRAEDNVTPLNPDRAADAADPANKVTPIHPGAARSAEEEIPKIDGDLHKQLKEALELLLYASDEGISIEPSVIETIVSASEKEKLNSKDIVSVITSITTLSATLRAKANRAIRPFLICVVVLGVFLIVFSTVSFLAGSYSKALSDEIARANEFALDLNAGNVNQIADPEMSKKPITDTKALTTLQQFAASIRAIHGSALELRWFVHGAAFPDDELMVEATPAALPAGQSRPPLELRIPATYIQIKEKTEQYQTVRSYAKTLQDTETAFYGALTNSILPSLYAILGVCAYLLKTFSEQVRAHTFRLSADAEGARFIVAAIGGGVVGLFSNFTSSPGNLSLLAVAFLIGYATDVFFTFLDGLEQAFMKPKFGEPARKTDGST
jgi:hypothetical protein